MKKIKSADEYFQYAQDNWRNILLRLRAIIKSTGLEETFKWQGPVYTHNGKNVVGLYAFKSFTSIWFFQGVFLKDEQNKLVNAQEGVTKALRQWRISDQSEIDEKLIKSYIEEAIANQEKGLTIKPERKKKLVMPEQLNQALNNNTGAKQAFKNLTPAKQREYVEHITEAKREKTRQNRIEKIIPMILDNRGLNDRYKN
jgi:uncharacterized protein YdeI (YjbR/CyaY-like superfamily)